MQNFRTKITALFHRTFWQPLRNPQRAAVLLGPAIGGMGFSLVNFVSAYSYASEGPLILLAYFTVLFLIGDAIYAPLIYLGFATKDGKAFRLGLIGAQIVAFACYIALGYQSLIGSFFLALLSAPYWSCFHMGMVQRTTDANRGYEVALSSFLGMCGGFLALGIGGLSLAHEVVYLAVSLGLVCLLGGTAALLWATNVKPQETAREYAIESKKIWRENPYLVRRIVALGLVEMPSFMMAALLSVLGFSAYHATAVLFSRLILNFILTPVIGKLVHGNTPGGFAKGMLILAGAWIFLLLMPRNDITFTIFLMAASFGLGAVSASGHVGWYQLHSYPAMMWHGVCLTIGRMLVLLALVPLLFYNPAYYMALVATIALALIAVNRQWRQTYKLER